jgi:signal transduction histidine kinase
MRAVTVASTPPAQTHPHAGRILFVDDDHRLLDGIRRRLRGRFAIETAIGPERGLEMLATQPPFAVVVADMNMPGMDGATFLARVQQVSPDSVRMMLTGNADLDTAVAAVNSGNIFRFMQKPIAGADLERFLNAGIEQRRLVDAMRRAAVAEQTSRAKSQFLATVSHELRTPLTVIRSTAEILEHFADDEPAAVRAEFTATIGRYARHLDGMVDQLLLLARLDAEEATAPGEQPFDLALVLRDAVERADAAAEADRPPTAVALDASATCRGDAAAITTAIVQLLANAHRFSAAAAPVAVTLRGTTSTACIEVADRGPGVPAAIADRLFEPFVQCAEVLTDKPAGLGLGLTIAHRIVQRHSGSITFRSEGGDTVFQIELPLHGAEGDPA